MKTLAFFGGVITAAAALFGARLFGLLLRAWWAAGH